ncbi:MAG: hypothetical protein GY909_05585 [Oligoflexia bacterium]|nr:hypothetical protein [Oligoflexia bacterium]
MPRTAKVKETNTKTEAGKNFKSFRTSDELEAFYRFVHENDLRREAKMALEYLVDKIKPAPKKRGRAKKVLQ